LGYEVRELIGKKTHAVWHHFKLDGSPYPEEECPIFTALKNGIAYHSTDEVLWKKDGTSLTAEFAVSPIKDGSQVIGAVATFWDTTRRRRDEQVIRAARETLEAIFNAITESLILLDKDGLVISMNKTAAERLGETAEELTGRSIYDLLAPGTENRRAEYESVIQSRRPSRFEDVLGEMILDQHVYPVFGADSSVERLVVFARDITEQKLTEDQLRQSEERFRTIFESARDCIYIRDRNLKYTHVNPAMEKIFGLPASELIGRTPRDLMTREQAACTADADKRVLKGEVVQTEHVVTIRGVNLRAHTILLPMHNAAGEIIGVCGISRDVTDLHRVEFPPHETIEKYPSKAMKSMLNNANLAAKRDTIVLLLGESGSGKDHLARYIHNRSSRADGPFFSINCAAITPSLAESELFGHERGAFTGAVGRKRGLLELADAGTLLLNEIGELSLALQSKLLSFLDTRKFTRVGGERQIRVNARLIAATNKDLEKEVENGTFRKDLLYRLNVMSIMVPPLRERIDDIPLLVQEILSKIRAELQLPEIPIVGVSTMNALKQYSWPGNVRELRNVLERASILSPGREISLPSEGLLCVEEAPIEDWSFKICFPADKACTEILDDLRNALAGEALRRSNGNRKNAARLLGISRDTFYRYMKSGAKD
ncbi:MAG: sigma 54-interacting transcriptional regulator, partial [Desulfomonilaceae bacterium]